MTIIIENLEQLINDDIASAGERGNKALKAMRKHLNDTIAIYTPQIVDAITKAGSYGLLLLNLSLVLLICFSILKIYRGRLAKSFL